MGRHHSAPAEEALESDSNNKNIDNNSPSHHSDTNSNINSIPEDDIKEDGHIDELHVHKQHVLNTTPQSSRKTPDLQVDIAATKASRNIESVSEASPTTSKKRKLNAPPSPPWKSAAAKTPSSFVDSDGRKRSARTNGYPAPPKPEPNTHKTRSSTRHSLPSTATSKSISGAKVANLKATPNKSTPKSKQSSSNKVTPKSLPTKHSDHERNSSSTTKKKSSLSKSQIKTPSRSRNNASSSQTNRRSSRHEKTKESTPSDDDEEQPDHDPYDFDENDSSELDEIEDSDIEVNDGRRISLRLTFSRKLKPAVIPNINCIPAPRLHASLREYFENEDVKETIQSDEAAVNEATRRFKIEQAYEEGILQPELLHAPLLVSHEGPEILRPQWGHRDHLIQHAMRFNKLLRMERTAHIKQARTIAIEAAKAAIKRIPKTREELELEQIQESTLKYKAIVGAIKSRMKMAERAAQDVLRERYLEAERAAGRETLKQMLQHSSTLLGERLLSRKKGPENPNGELLQSDDEDDQNQSNSEETSEHDSIMSDSDEGSASSSDAMALDDDLTAEELRLKYASLSEPAVDESSQLNGYSSPDMHERSRTPTSLSAKSSEKSFEDNLGESDEDIPMDSEVDEDDFQEEDSMDSENESELDNGGLLGFYSKTDILDLQLSIDNQAESSVDETFLYKNQEEDEDEEELSEVEMVPVSRREDSPEAVFEDANGLEGDEHDKETIREMVVTTEVSDEENEDEDDEYRPTVEYEHDTTDRKPLSVSSESSSLQKTGASEFSSATTPMSISVNVEVKEEPKTPIPHILRGSLREYQHHGLDWLAGLYDNGTNGILADEMGLGKTIQTIALLSHLAIAKGVWGQHLIIVPTSVILNWEMEFKKWAPAFRILTYYGNKEERQEKRRGWMKDDWNVCITSYQLVVQDVATLKRRPWHYMILDEAHNIKNFKSQRWQTLLGFKAEARLLLTGTPLQNNLMELWSLLYFLMPSGSGMSRVMPEGFTNLKEFQEWFARPVDQLIEGGREGMDEESRDSIKKLHNILRPFLLRRLKREVEKQMPGKYEHIVWCHLSKRQRFLYEEFMSRAQTKETLISGNYLSIINCLMQLRKVCNHPDLFETRQIVTSFAMNKSAVADYEIKELFLRRKFVREGAFDMVDLGVINMIPTLAESNPTYHYEQLQAWHARTEIESEIIHQEELLRQLPPVDVHSVAGINNHVRMQDIQSKISHLQQVSYINSLRTSQAPLYGKNVTNLCQELYRNPLSPIPPQNSRQLLDYLSERSNSLRSMTISLQDRADLLDSTVDKFGCITPLVVTTDMPRIAIPESVIPLVNKFQETSLVRDPFHRAQNRLSIAFPDKRLLQYDCGKLQKLDELLRNLQAGGHRALIFTQMTKVLDILEQFLNIHGHRYLRLDGATKIEQRQILTERFNSDNRILVFILSTRSGGLGINLTGADSVIFYDLDWNPAMDKQCQDRCHRIGQTRDVHIYRFVSEYTIESNILRKSNQKQMLDDVVIQEGEFTVDKFNNLTVADLFGDEARKLGLDRVGGNLIVGSTGDMTRALEQVEDTDDVVAAKIAEKDNANVLDERDFGRDNVDNVSITEDDGNTITPMTRTDEPESISHEESVAAEIELQKARQQQTDDDKEGEQMATEDHENHQEEDEEEDDDNVQSIDDYLLRFWTWELRDSLIILPNKHKKKGSKKVKPP